MNRYTRMALEPEMRRRRYSNGRYAPSMRYDEPRMDHHEKVIGFERHPHMEEEYEMELEHMEFTHEEAEEWVSMMRNEDGTHGAHWSFDRVKKLMEQYNIKHNPAEFWAIMNMLYSDYCGVFKKYGMNGVDLYVDLALAWMGDKDAVEDKAAMYWECIVRH